MLHLAGEIYGLLLQQLVYPNTTLTVAFLLCSFRTLNLLSDVLREAVVETWGAYFNENSLPFMYLRYVMYDILTHTFMICNDAHGEDFKRHKRFYSKKNLPYTFVFQSPICPP